MAREWEAHRRANLSPQTSTPEPDRTEELEHERRYSQTGVPEGLGGRANSRGPGRRALHTIGIRRCTDHSELARASREVFETSRLERSVEVKGLARLARCRQWPGVYTGHPGSPALQT